MQWKNLDKSEIGKEEGRFSAGVFIMINTVT